MSAALFFDPACVSPYSARTLEEAALGGIEGLSDAHHGVAERALTSIHRQRRAPRTS